jgi:hypothetical protein
LQVDNHKLNRRYSHQQAEHDDRCENFHSYHAQIR